MSTEIYDGEYVHVNRFAGRADLERPDRLRWQFTVTNPDTNERQWIALDRRGIFDLIAGAVEALARGDA